MRTLLIAALALTGMAATSVVAQPAPSAPAPATAAAAAKDASTHEMCKAMMGRKMDAKQPHDHGRDKSGAVTWPSGKPLSDAEMADMHKRCADKMAKPEPAK